MTSGILSFLLSVFWSGHFFLVIMDGGEMNLKRWNWIDTVIVVAVFLVVVYFAAYFVIGVLLDVLP